MLGLDSPIGECCSTEAEEVMMLGNVKFVNLVALGKTVVDHK